MKGTGTTVITSAIHTLDTPRSLEWEHDAQHRFVDRMLDQNRPFPCVFGVDAVRKGTLRAAFVDIDDTARLSEALSEFTSIATELGRRTSLVVFFGPQAENSPMRLSTIDDYRQRFWTHLQEVHALDPEPWPLDIPTDTDDPTFEFSFGGMPMFVVANTPAHDRRASRFFDYFAITFQPRFVFEDIAADTAQGQNARRIIRARLNEYDSAPITPLLGNFGEPGNREWEQYFLEDDNDQQPLATRCPFMPIPKEQIMSTQASSGSPFFGTDSTLSLAGELADLLPAQGSLELQRDKPWKKHDWHQHNVDEELFVLSGDVKLFWANDDGDYHERVCNPGTRITLPAGTRHGSIAGPEGVVYIIRPKDGVAAVTTFLAAKDHPVLTETNSALSE